MNPFQYVTAHTPNEAISLVGENGRYLGGGIDLLGEMKDYIATPDILVALKGYDKHVGKGPSEIIIDARMTVAELAEHPGIQSTLPGLAQAASEVGSPQIRNVATVGGNLLQHSRCWYYRQPDIVCLKRGGPTCYGHDGENKYLSLFSDCSCISPIVSNLAVALTALQAVVEIHGKPAIQITDLYAPAWKNSTSHNSLQQGDLVKSISVPEERKKSAYRQVSEKREFDWALVSCAAAGNVKDGKITDARVVLGAVAPVPYMVPEANQFLDGKPLTDETASKAADIILKDAKPLAQNGYKVPLAHALIRRTLLALNP